MNYSKRTLLTVFVLAALSAIVVSQLIGYLICAYLAVGETFVVNSFLWFTHVRNYGGIFGSFQGKGWFFALLSFCLLSGFVVYLVRAKTLEFCHYLCFGLIVGGGASNILDRLLFGAVIDFVNLQRIPYWKYIFNTADVMIHLGIWPTLLLNIRERKKIMGDSQCINRRG